MSSSATFVLPTAAGARLNSVKVTVLAAYGIALWYIAALMVRYGTAAGLYGRDANLFAYIATALAFGPLIWAARRTARGLLLPAITIVSLAALLCDGLAITWWPTLYGPDAASSLPGIAWLSFAVACGLLWALLLEMPAAAQRGQ